MCYDIFICFDIPGLEQLLNIVQGRLQQIRCVSRYFTCCQDRRIDRENSSKRRQQSQILSRCTHTWFNKLRKPKYPGSRMISLNAKIFDQRVRK